MKFLFYLYLQSKYDLNSKDSIKLKTIRMYIRSVKKIFFLQVQYYLNMRVIG